MIPAAGAVIRMTNDAATRRAHRMPAVELWLVAGSHTTDHGDGPVTYVTGSRWIATRRTFSKRIVICAMIGGAPFEVVADPRIAS